MTKDQFMLEVSSEAFVEPEECNRVVKSYQRVLKREAAKEVKKYATIAGGVLAFLAVFGLIFYLAGRSDGKK